MPVKTLEWLPDVESSAAPERFSTDTFQWVPMDPRGAVENSPATVVAFAVRGMVPMRLRVESSNVVPPSGDRTMNTLTSPVVDTPDAPDLTFTYTSASRNLFVELSIVELATAVLFAREARVMVTVWELVAFC